MKRLAGPSQTPWPATIWIAIVVANLLPAAVNLPLLFLITPDAMVWIVTAVIALPGMLFGWPS